MNFLLEYPFVARPTPNRRLEVLGTVGSVASIVRVGDTGFDVHNCGEPDRSCTAECAGDSFFIGGRSEDDGTGWFITQSVSFLEVNLVISWSDRRGVSTAVPVSSLCMIARTSRITRHE